MGSVTLTAEESLEVENALLKEAVQNGKCETLEKQLVLLRELAAHMSKDKELLFLRLMAKYGLEGKKGLRFGVGGKTIEFPDEVPAAPSGPPTEPGAPTPLRKKR